MVVPEPNEPQTFEAHGANFTVSELAATPEASALKLAQESGKLVAEVRIEVPPLVPAVPSAESEPPVGPLEIGVKVRSAPALVLPKLSVLEMVPVVGTAFVAKLYRVLDEYVIVGALPVPVLTVSVVLCPVQPVVATPGNVAEAGAVPVAWTASARPKEPPTLVFTYTVSVEELRYAPAGETSATESVGGVAATVTGTAFEVAVNEPKLATTS